MPVRRNRVVKKVLKNKKKVTKPVVNSIKHNISNTIKKKKTKNIEEDEESKDDTEYPEIPEDEREEDYSSNISDNENKSIEIKVPKINDMIRERYSELLKELWENENQLNELQLNTTIKNLLNRRSKLWIEYFISTYTFNNYKNLDIFNYMDNFNNSTNYL